MVVFASLVVGFCSGFPSLFGVVLCELGKKGKPTGRPSGRALSAGFPSSLLRLNGAKRRRQCWGLLGFESVTVFNQRDK
jgi:hypothetical protein